MHERRAVKASGGISDRDEHGMGLVGGFTHGFGRFGFVWVRYSVPKI